MNMKVQDLFENEGVELTTETNDAKIRSAYKNGSLTFKGEKFADYIKKHEKDVEKIQNDSDFGDDISSVDTAGVFYDRKSQAVIELHQIGIEDVEDGRETFVFGAVELKDGKASNVELGAHYPARKKDAKENAKRFRDDLEKEYPEMIRLDK
jgi:hypothetical protein